MFVHYTELKLRYAFNATFIDFDKIVDWHCAIDTLRFKSVIQLTLVNEEV